MIRSTSWRSEGDHEVFECPEHNITVLIDKYDGNDKERTMEEMSKDCIVAVCGEYTVSNGNVVYCPKDHEDIRLEMELSLMNSKSMVRCSVPTAARTVRCKPLVMEPLVWLSNYYKNFSIYMMMRAGISGDRILDNLYNVYKKSFILGEEQRLKGLDWNHHKNVDDNGVPTLFVLAMRACCLYNNHYTGRFGNFLISAGYGNQTECFLNAMKKIDTKSNEPEVHPLFAKICNKAYQMHDKVNDLERYIGKFDGEIKPSDIWLSQLDRNTSAGESCYPEDEGCKVPLESGDTNVAVIMTTAGKKFVQAHSAREFMAEDFNQYQYTGKLADYDVIYKVSEKAEYKFYNGLVLAEYLKQATGERLFFQPNTLDTLSRMVANSLPIAINKTGGNLIGMNWEYGGATEYARRMKVIITADDNFVLWASENPDFEYGDFDVSSMDARTTNAELGRQQMRHLRFFDPKSPWYRLRRELIKRNAKNIMNKLVHVFGLFWAIFLGKNPSGTFDTSDGNTTLMQMYWFYFLSFLYYTKIEIQELIDSLLDNGDLPEAATGDDNNGCWPKKYRKYFSYTHFAEYLEKYHNLVIRDLRDGIPFLSTPNYTTGGIKVKGVVMTKNYFIARPDFMPTACQPVVTYRTLDAVLPKFCATSDKSNDTLATVIKAVSLCYLAGATNPLIYDFASGVFRQGLKELDMDPEDYRAAIEKRVESLEARGLRYRCGASKEEIGGGIPSREELYSRHIPCESNRDGKRRHIMYEDEYYSVEEFNSTSAATEVPEEIQKQLETYKIRYQQMMEREAEEAAKQARKFG